MTESGLPPGSVFAGYQIERVLGVGGMGTVYLAGNPSLPRSDALKVLSAELSRDASFRARFIREADVSAGLSHPNIVGIYRRGEADGQLWIAMQFVDGTDAEKALQAGTMTPRRAVHIIGEVAKALDYAHQRHVVHRDVKPANFLLSSDGDEGERVLLADFGIARALDDAHSLTATGSVMATVTYAAPEALTGAKVDGRADIYGLGCSLFRLMTGRAPYPGKDIAAVMMAHLNQPPPRLSSVRPGLPPALDDVLATAMAKDPAQRYRTARELAAAASAALTGSAAPPSGTPPWGLPTTSFPAPASSPVPTNPVGFVGASGPAPTAASRRRRPAVMALAGAAVLVAAVTGIVLATRHSTESDRVVAGPSTPTPVEDSALTGFLLGAQKLSAITGVTVGTDPAQSLLASDYELLVDPTCSAAFAPGQINEYQGNGWIASRYQAFHEVGTPVNSMGIAQFGQQVVVTFISAEAADVFAKKQATHWQQCSNTQLKLRPRDPTKSIIIIQVGEPSTADGILKLSQNMEGGAGMVCGRALTARNNVVVDVTNCGFDNALEHTVEMAQAIRDGIPDK